MANEWTWLIDMAGDNNLSNNTASDLRKISRGDSDKVSVCVQLNRSAQDTQRLCLEGPKLVERLRFRNVSSGSPFSLADFVRWGMANQPASLTLLCLWSHGNGWLDFPYTSIQSNASSTGAKRESGGAPPGPKYAFQPAATQFFKQPYNLISRLKSRRDLFRDVDFALDPVDIGSLSINPTGINPFGDGTAPTPLAIAIPAGGSDQSGNVETGGTAETSVSEHPFLSNTDLSDALESALKNGPRIAIIGCDACWMSMVEVTHQIRKYAEVFIGSEDEEDTNGWPYDRILRRFGKSSLTAEGAAAVIVAEYSKANKDNPFATLSAVRLERMDALADALDALGAALRVVMPAWLGTINLARKRTRFFKQFSYIDLYDFALQLIDGFEGVALAAGHRIREAARRVLAAVDESVVLAMDNQPKGTARGISIYLPNEPVASNYGDLSLSEAAPHWAAFVTAYGKSFPPGKSSDSSSGSSNGSSKSSFPEPRPVAEDAQQPTAPVSSKKRAAKPSLTPPTPSRRGAHPKKRGR
jgi:hypothetical protein